MDKIVSAISDNGSIICYAIDSTQIVSRAEQIHKTSAVVTAALGRQLTATSLMGYQMLEDDQTLTARIQGGGPIGVILTVTDAQGNVRGYVGQPVVEIPSIHQGKLNVGGAVGTDGMLQIMRDLGGDSAEPFTGSVPLVSGEIAEDFTSYYAHSEQIPTVMALGVLVGSDLRVVNAGGFLAQLLPGASEEDITQLENNIAALPSVTELYSAGNTPESLVDLVLKGMAPRILETQAVEYRCNCTRERVEKALISIGKDELLTLAEEEKKAEIDCHFCPKIYRFNEQELRDLAEQTGE